MADPNPATHPGPGPPTVWHHTRAEAPAPKLAANNAGKLTNVTGAHSAVASPPLARRIRDAPDCTSLDCYKAASCPVAVAPFSPRWGSPFLTASTPTKLLIGVAEAKPFLE